MSNSVRWGAAVAFAMVAGAAMIVPVYTRAVGQGAEPAETVDADAGRAVLSNIRGYKRWTRVNPRPLHMEPAAAAQCAAPSSDQRPSPHLRKFITVFVNGPGRSAMLKDKNPTFPAGAVIVKEKLSSADSKRPELMTVMIKHEKGFNAENGDWEYAVVDGSGKKVTADGKLDRCQSCHSNQPARGSDFVFRNYYLPESRLEALR